jgi:predicted Zn-dependent protease
MMFITKHFLRGLLFASTASMMIAAAAPSPSLPDLGDESGALLSPQDERRLGEEIMREARRSRQIVILDDPEVGEYLRKLGGRIAKPADSPNGFQFFLINHSTINAFAVPGGFIGVHTGLLLAARNEGELASVLAHETAHITQRHIPRMLADNERMKGPALAGILAGLLLAASGAPGAEAAIALTTAGMAQHQLNFSRAFEQEADRIGMNYLDAAGFDARGMPAFFERLDSLTRLYDTNPPEFLLTHPITARRISESRDHAEHFPARTNPGELDFRLMQARLRVLGAKPDEALNHFRASLDSADAVQQEANRYGLALSFLATRQHDKAADEAARLARQRTDQLAYQLLLADIELARGNNQNGLALFAAQARQRPDSLAASQRHAEALIKNRRMSEAYQVLDQLTRIQRRDPALFKLLATAAGDAGKPLEAHRAYAEYYYLLGDPRAAVDQLEMALRHAHGKFYYVSGIEARIREIREEFTELFKRKEPEKPRGPSQPGRK